MWKRSSFGLVAFVAAATASVFACTNEVGPTVVVDGEAPPGAPIATTEAPSPSPTTTTALDDETIAGVVRTIHREQIREATLARTRAFTPALFQYADGVATDHAASLDLQAAKLGDVVPDDGPWETSRETSEQAVARVSDLEGMSFDVAYLERQLVAQSELVALVDGMLARESSETRRAELVRLRTDLVLHLERARSLEPFFPVNRTPE